ncbi:MAG: hypothetical protein GY696_39540, partial [Gammaproteobacteria bacterium]|nr:hypothetical protein [Gammaproteobacteria bacterium]
MVSSGKGNYQLLASAGVGNYQLPALAGRGKLLASAGVSNYQLPASAGAGGMRNDMNGSYLNSRFCAGLERANSAEMVNKKRHETPFVGSLFGNGPSVGTPISVHKGLGTDTSISQSNKFFENSGLFGSGPKKPQLGARHESLVDDPKRNNEVLSLSSKNDVNLSLTSGQEINEDITDKIKDDFS